jgi:hypothetical protein
MDYQLPANWPVWAALTYLIIKDTLPMLSNLIAKMTGIIVPAHTTEKKLLLEQQNKNMERQVELEEQRIDLREREVVALEQIGKSLVVIDTRLQSLDRKSDLITTGLVTANQALSIMMDRVHRRREDYESKPAPTIECRYEKPTQSKENYNETVE